MSFVLRIGILFGLVLAAGCSLKGQDGDSTLYLDLSSLSGGTPYLALTESGGFWSLTAAPSDPKTFSCYAVNVTGPGIPDTSPNPDPAENLGDVFDKLITGQSYCSYRGVVTPTFYLASGSAQVALQVPPGGVRLVQVVGVNDPLVCAAGVINDPPGSTSSGGGRYFEIGRAVLNDLFSDRSVDVQTNWPTGATAADDTARAARALDCGGTSCTTLQAFTSSTTVGSSESAVSIATTSNQYAVQVPNAVGNYIRKAAFKVSSASTGNLPVSLTASIYSAVGAGSTLATATAVSGYTQTLSIDPATGAAWVEFGLGISTSNYLQIQSGYNYWIVLSSSDAGTTPAGNGAVNVYGSALGGHTSTGSFQYTSGWNALSGFEDLYSKILDCN